MIDYYQLLNISPDATEAEIKKAIRQQRAKYRRRVDSSPDIDTRTMAEKKVEQIGEAEKILTDPEKRDAYDQQLQSAPPDNSSDQPTRSGNKDWLAVSREYYRNGDTRKAYSAAKEATDVQSNNAQAWEFRALLASELNKYDDADFAIDQGIQIEPNNAGLHSTAASIAYDEEKYDTAITEYRKTIKLDPSDYRAAIQIGYMMALSGRDEEGFNHFKSLHDVHPDNSDITKNFVSYALIYLESKLSTSEGKFPTDDVPTNETQLKAGVEIMNEIESLEVDDDDLNAERQSYKEALDYAGKRHFTVSTIFGGIKSIIVWFIALLIVNWLFHGFVHFLAIVIITAVLAFALYFGVLPYGYELNRDKVSEEAAQTGVQNA